MPLPIIFAAEKTTTPKKSSIYPTPQKKQKMIKSQTYLLAHSVRSKLSREAARADHHLRLVVGHANMLDSLMVSLANAEQQEEQWFNKSPFSAREEEIRHDTTVTGPEGDWEAEDTRSSDESDDEEEHVKPVYPIRASITEVTIDFDDEEDQSLALLRTVSRHSPLKLTKNDDWK